MSLWSRLFGGANAGGVTYSSEERKIFAASLRIGWTVLAFGVFGLLFIGVWANGIVLHTAEGSQSLFAFFGADLLVAAAAGAAGALFGFVFAIPRTLDPASRAAVAGAASQAGTSATSHAVLAANTNLERISDWLTTLLIGATLVQIKDIATWVGALGKNLVAVGPAANDAIVPIIVIYYFALAFLGVYLITRLYLTSAFLQTLGMLAGGVGSPDRPLRELKAVLDDAGQSAKPEDVKAALDSFDSWSFGEGERIDPDLNAKLAHVLSKSIASGVDASRPGDAAGGLKSAIVQASTDTAVKTKLKEDVAAGRLSTGRSTLDLEIAKMLA